MKTKRAKISSLVLAFLVCVCAVLSNTSIINAAEPQYDTILDEQGTAVANTETTYNFTVDTNTNVYLYYYVPTAVNCTLKVYTSSGELYGEKTILSTELDYSDEIGLYYYDLGCSNMPSGDYTVKLTFDADVQFAFGVDVEKIVATISQKSLTLTAGFTKKLKVDNTTDTVTWSSNKKSVATVSSKGVVTAKKAGTATITAKTKSGQKLTCKVTVKANTYKETKYSTSNVSYGDCILQVYRASYASNGDLVLKCRLINNSGHKTTSLKNLKIKFTTDAGKTIGTYSVKSKSMSLSSGSTKDFSVTIKKSKLKIKKADLRNSTYSTSGTYNYYY